MSIFSFALAFHCPFLTSPFTNDERDGGCGVLRQPRRLTADRACAAQICRRPEGDEQKSLHRPRAGPPRILARAPASEQSPATATTSCSIPRFSRGRETGDGESMSLIGDSGSRTDNDSYGECRQINFRVLDFTCLSRVPLRMLGLDILYKCFAVLLSVLL